MGKVKVEDVIIAKSRGLINVIKKLSEKIKENMIESNADRTELLNSISSGNSTFESEKERVARIEIFSRDNQTISSDIEKLLIKLGVYLDTLNTLEAEFKITDEDDDKVIDLAKRYNIEKDLFVYGVVGDNVVVLNENFKKEIDEGIEQIKENSDFLNRLYESAKKYAIGKK